MDKYSNRFNKGRNKNNQNSQINPNNPYGKRPNKMFSMMNYETGQYPPFYLNEEYMMGQPHPFPNMHPIPVQGSGSKEQNIKNVLKYYQKNNNMIYNQSNAPNELMNMGDNEMSLEDNNQIGNKKFNNKNWKQGRNQRKRKIHQFNKELMNGNQINNNNFEPISSRAISTENNIVVNENIPEAYYNSELNYNNFPQKGGKKKAQTYEYRNRKRPYKHPKQKYDDYKNININNNQNIKTYTNQQKVNYNISDIEEDSIINNKNNDIDDNNYNYNNDYYNAREEEEFEDEQAEEDENSQDIKVIEDSKDNNYTNNDDAHKEVIDISKIKLIEKKEKEETDSIIDIKSSDDKDKIHKVKIIPELTEMCSAKEIMEREKEKDLDSFEVDPDSFPFKKCIKEQMVQKYRRKMGQILKLDDPKEIRNIPAINKSINYLIEQILDCDNDNIRKFKINRGFTIYKKDIIDFIFDRFVAIYKTIDLLKDNDDSKNLFDDCQIVENICRMVRTIIILINLCYDEFVDKPYHVEEINLLIDELLLPLLTYIIDIINNESKYQFNLSEKDKDEFLSYYLFIKLKKDRKNFSKIYEKIELKINYSHPKIELVNEIFAILNGKNSEKFMEILKSEKCDYLTACLMSLFFKEICTAGLMKLSLKSKKVQFNEIYDMLTFENIDEVQKFLIWFEVPSLASKRIINEGDTVTLPVHSKNKHFNYDKAPQFTNKRFIEKKRGNKIRRDMVSPKVEFKKNEKYIKKDTTKISESDKNKDIKNVSLIKSDIAPEKNIQSSDYNDASSLKLNNDKKDVLNVPANESFISRDTFQQIFDNPPIKQNQNLNNKSDKKNSSQKISKDFFPKPLTPKKIFSDTDKNNNMNKSLDAFSQTSISSIEGNYKNYPYFNEQTLEFFCDVSSSIINKIISDLKFDFIYRLKFIVEKYKIKLELIENYIDRRKFFAFHEFKIKCLNEKYSKQYYKELINYNNNLNSENTNENFAFKIIDKNLLNNKKFELLTYEDIIYFLIKDQEKFVQQSDDKNVKLINHLQINIYTTKDLIKSTKIISSLKLKKSMLKENSDGSELTIIDNNIDINSNNKLSLIIKFIFVDQIIDLDSYIYDNQKNMSKYAILIPFFDIIKSDPESQQILTKFFTILDLGLGSFIKKDIIFFFIKRDIEQTSDLYKDYQNIQNDFIFNLMQKYSNNANKNSIIYIDDDYANNEKVKEKIVYLSPIDEFGKCYQEYIKYLNNKTFVELFENNKLFHLNVFNPKEVLIPFEKHIYDLDILVNHYLDIIEKDLQKYLEENKCINYFYNNKLCIEVLIGFIMCKILLIYYQYISLSFANELFKVPFCNSNIDLLILEDNLLNAGSIFRQINIDGYDYIWKQCFSIDTQKKKNIFSYFDIFSELICQYNLISDIDIQNYEYCFRKQYYDFNLEKKNYEIAKNFVNFFNKIIIKFVSNNNLNIKNNKNTAEIFEKIYNKNKLFLLKNISKIITNNIICFTESIIYMNGIGDVYHGLEKVEFLEYNKNLSKKRKRNIPLMNTALLEIKKKNNLKSNNKANKNMKIINEMNENFQIASNVMDINESKSINKSKTSFIYETGDISDDYYKSFRKVRKYNFQNSP